MAPDGSSFTIRASTPPGSVCGGVTGDCTKAAGTSQDYFCDYNWDDGGGGTFYIIKH
jgi:hypothetical protein